MKNSKKVEHIISTPLFDRLSIMLIVLNTLFMMVEHYEMPKWLDLTCEYANLVFTFVFLIEMLLKMFGLGCKNYIADNFNIFDAVIVLLSLVELLIPKDDGSGSMLSVLRTFRLLRVFKIIKSWKSLKMLLTTVLKSF